MTNTVCFFASYFEQPNIPQYVKTYLLELKNHCSDIIFTYVNENLNIESKEFLNKNKIKFELVTNEGYDFGQWNKAMDKVDIYKYDKLVFVNDSCILFAPLNDVLNWFNLSKLNFGGITKSEFQNKHIQSYFLIFNKETFKDIKFFFEHNALSNFVFDIIKTYEIGLSQYLISKHYTCDSYLSNDGYTGEFSPYYHCVISHINQGSPMIKKKIIESSYRKDELFTLARMNFDINCNTYIELINKTNKYIFYKLNEHIKTTKNKLTMFTLIKYHATRLIIVLYKKLK